MSSAEERPEVDLTKVAAAFRAARVRPLLERPMIG
jgi:hypothetical protein